MVTSNLKGDTELQLEGLRVAGMDINSKLGVETNPSSQGHSILSHDSS